MPPTNEYPIAFNDESMTTIGEYRYFRRGLDYNSFKIQWTGRGRICQLTGWSAAALVDLEGLCQSQYDLEKDQHYHQELKSETEPRLRYIKPAVA